MKKLILIILMVTLMVLNLTGCSGSEAQIKDEPEGKMSSEQDNANDAAIADMKDMDAFYEFFKQDINDLSRENFDMWEVNYLDITGDGSKEAIFAGVHGVEWPQKMQIISGDTGEYKKIPSDIPLAKYKNLPTLQDGFFAVDTETGGTGEHFNYLDLYIYNGSEIVKVLEGLLMNHTVSFPGQTEFEENAEIEGKLTDFIYTLTKQDNITEKISVEMEKKYIYDANAMSFVEELITEKASVEEEANSEEFSYNVSNGSLQIAYGDDTVTVIEANRIYDYIKDDFNGQEEFYVLRTTKVDGSKLYFTVKAPDYSVGEVSYYIDVNTKKIYWIESLPDTENNESDEIGEGVRLSGFTNETIRDTQIDYGTYSAVIIPFYPSDGMNHGSLVQVPFLDDPEGRVLDFAVMGKLEDLKITFIENMESEGIESELGELENAVLNIHSNLPTDMSYYKITGKVHVGEGYYEDVSFTLDDMRDSSEYDVYLIK